MPPSPEVILGTTPSPSAATAPDSQRILSVPLAKSAGRMALAATARTFDQVAAKRDILRCVGGESDHRLIAQGRAASTSPSPRRMLKGNNRLWPGALPETAGSVFMKA